MKKILSLFSIVIALSFVNHLNVQDKVAECVYKQVGSENIYKGKIYYNVDNDGDPYVISYNIPGIPDGKGEFYQRKESPGFTEEKIGNITYKYFMPINGSGLAYFNLVCEKCR